MTTGPTLGTGLFVGTGQALAAGGPASLIFSYVFISALVYCVTTGIAEVSTHSLGRNGALISHTYHYTSNHLGFSISYLRWISLAVMVPFEVTTAMVHLQLWTPGSDIALRMGVVMGIIFGFNMLPDKVFRKSQSFFTGLKFVVTTSLMSMAGYIAIRDDPNRPVKGFHYWSQPGPFNEFLARGDFGRFLGLVYCLLCSTITVVFIPELTVQRAEQHDGEQGNSIFRFTRNSNLVMFVLYIMTALSATIMAPYTDQSLTNNGTGAGLSPYTVGTRDSGLRLLSMVAAGMILLSSVASGRSFLHLSSRMLANMAEAGHAPAMFMVRNRWNVPYISVAITAMFTWLTFLCMATSSSAVHNYLMFFITTSGYLSWICSCITYIRFRRAVDRAEIIPVHRSFAQPFGVWFALVASILLTGLNLSQIVIAPRHQFNPQHSIPAHIAVGLFTSMYLSHRLITGIRKKTSQMESSADDDVETLAERSQGQAVELQKQKQKREGEGSAVVARHGESS
ncbi:amino acid permease/ SLC12A domain-containing protein [Aspergillus pseudoustus]|uniref:Amino acid permease/ SLC12A domain-containing protein n=1 Tax=Aspergillus pseudoustus TaxID=1810923 RepID=A0ABR4IW90_9EURO